MVSGFSILRLGKVFVFVWASPSVHCVIEKFVAKDEIAIIDKLKTKLVILII